MTCRSFGWAGVPSSTELGDARASRVSLQRYGALRALARLRAPAALEKRLEGLQAECLEGVVLVDGEVS